MTDETWVDGFNLFHRWAATRELFAPGCEIGQAQSRALCCLASRLGRQRQRAIVFMDGGLAREAQTLHGVRVRWAGPGEKADQGMIELLGARGRPRSVLAITSDRALAAHLRSLGGRVQDAEAFISERLAAADRRDPEAERVRTIKDAPLSKAEQEAWLDMFAEDAGGKHE